MQRKFAGKENRGQVKQKVMNPIESLHSWIVSPIMGGGHVGGAMSIGTKIVVRPDERPTMRCHRRCMTFFSCTSCFDGFSTDPVPATSGRLRIFRLRFLIFVRALHTSGSARPDRHQAGIGVERPITCNRATEHFFLVFWLHVRPTRFRVTGCES